MKMTLQKKTHLFLAIFFVCFIWGINKTSAQDLHFSQYYNSPLSLNPSLAGAFNGSVRLGTNYRNQWSSISQPYRTYAFSSDFGLFRNILRKGYLGLGIYLYSDKAGTSQLKNTQINLSLAFHKKISGNSILSAGIQGGYTQRSINFDNLKWDNQYNGNSYDPSLPSLEQNFNNDLTYSDFSGGVQWTYSKGDMYAIANNQTNINAGIALFHMNQPNISFYSFSKDILPIKFIIYGNSQIAFKHTKRSFQPMFIYVQQGSMKDIMAGGLFRMKLVDESKYTGYTKGAAFSFGGLYRFGDAIIPVAQVEFANYSIGMSYDINASDLTNVTLGKGGFEISLKFVNPNPFTGKTVLIKNPRYFN